MILSHRFEHNLVMSSGAGMEGWLSVIFPENGLRLFLLCQLMILDFFILEAVKAMARF